MNGFVVFEASDAVSQFLGAEQISHVDAQFTAARRRPVVIFRDLPEYQLPLLREVAASFGGILEEAQQYAPLS